jgi:hypothetical protein
VTDRLSIRMTSFALATIVTWSLFAGIDTLALEQHAGGLQMSQAPAATATAVAATPIAPKS